MEKLKATECWAAHLYGRALAEDAISHQMKHNLEPGHLDLRDLVLRAVRERANDVGALPEPQQQQWKAHATRGAYAFLCEYLDGRW